MCQGLKGMRRGRDWKAWGTITYWTIKPSHIMDEGSEGKPGSGQCLGLPHGCQMAAPPPALHPEFREEAASDKEKVVVPVSYKQNSPTSPAESLMFGILYWEVSTFVLNNKSSRVQGFNFCTVHVGKEKSAIPQMGIHLRKQHRQLQCFVTRARNYQVRQLVRISFFIWISFS